MDLAVLDADGWTDIPMACEFEEEWQEDEAGEGGARRHKRTWRYRWLEIVRDEVLIHLLALNSGPAEHEKRAGLRTGTR